MFLHLLTAYRHLRITKNYHDQCDKASTFCVERDKLSQPLIYIDSHCANLRLTLDNLKQEDNHGQTVKWRGNGGADKKVGFDCVNRVCAIQIWAIESIMRDNTCTMMDFSSLYRRSQ